MPRQLRLLTVLLALALCSCKEDAIMHTYQSIPRVWNGTDTVKFALPKNIEEKGYGIEVGVRYFEFVTVDTMKVGIRVGKFTGEVEIPFFNTYHEHLGQGNNLYTIEIPCGMTHTLHPSDTLYIYNAEERAIEGIGAVGVRISH